MLVLFHVSSLFLYGSLRSLNVIGLDLMLLPTGPGLVLIVNLIISSVDTSCMWSESKGLILYSLWHLKSLLLSCHIWITFLVSLFFVMPVHAWSINATWEFSSVVCSVMVLRLTTEGATTKPKASCGQSTHGCAARHELVSRLLVVIPYATTPVC